MVRFEEKLVVLHFCARPLKHHDLTKYMVILPTLANYVAHDNDSIVMFHDNSLTPAFVNAII